MTLRRIAVVREVGRSLIHAIGAWLPSRRARRSRRLEAFELVLPGWTERASGDRAMRHWTSTNGMILTAGMSQQVFRPDDVGAFRKSCRQIAEARGGGLIEADVVSNGAASCGRMVFKKPHERGFLFTGMVFLPDPGGTLILSVVDGERGTTGGREAAVAARLLRDGSMTHADYDASWAQDPYDPAYSEVTKATLRYVSDDTRFDPDFPMHPLTRVRWVVSALVRAHASVTR